MEQDPIRVLLIDDDEDDYVVTRDMLREARGIAYDLEWISSYDRGLPILIANQHDIYLIDYRLGGHSGLELLRAAVAGGCCGPIILLTGQGDHEVDVEAMSAGASDYLIKGKIDANVLERSIRYSIRNKQAEIRLMRSELAHRRLIEGLPEGVALVDLNEVVLFINPAGCRIFGYEADEMVGKSLRNKVTAAGWEKVRDETKKRSAGLSSQYELEVVRKDGTVRDLLVSATPHVEEGRITGTIGGFVDVTDLRNAEKEKAELREKLARAQRMESLGVLAGGVAHDLNNILGPLVAYPQLLIMKLGDDHPLKEKLLRMQNSAERAAEVVQDLLALARRGRYEMAPLDLNSVVTAYMESPEFSELAANARGVEMVTELAPGAASIHGSSAHLYKVVMNLVRNAVEAMPSGGTLLISTQVSHLERLESGFDNIQAGDYCVLSVSDTGLGIEEKHLKRLFEPFFSKKEMGKSGSGLGLAIVYGIIKDHNGYVDVKSERGVGTRFVVYLPASHQKTVSGPSSRPLDIRGHEEILVVDDVEEQRELASTILGSLGYRVRTAANGHEAVAFLAKGGRADIVILDMIMEPEFDGLDTFKEILRNNPEQLAMIASGFAETDRVKEAERLGVRRFLRKPYTMNQLGQAIREVIQEEVERREATEAVLA